MEIEVDWEKGRQFMVTAFAYDALQALRNLAPETGEHFPKRLGGLYGEFRYWTDAVTDPDALHFLAQIVRSAGRDLQKKLATPASQP